MLRQFVARVVSHSTRSKTFLKSFELPLFVSKHSQCSSISSNSALLQKWIESLTEDKRKRVKLIQNEIAVKEAELKRVPQWNAIQISEYEEMLKMSTSQRQRYYDFLFVTKAAESHHGMKQLIRQRISDEKKKMETEYNTTPKHIEYGYSKNTITPKIRRSTIIKWRNWKLHRAIMLNKPPLIFDCGFCDAMTKLEIGDTAKQLKYAFSENRLSRQPFVMHLCNVEKTTPLWHELNRVMPNIEKIPWKIHSCDVSEIFPLDNLVYLSPDASEVMDKFDVDDRYVVGSIVDRGSILPLSLAKAKKLKIRSVRLPLEKYIRFHSHKTLTLDQMTKILLELKQSQNWPKALKHVPARRISS